MYFAFITESRVCQWQLVRSIPRRWNPVNAGSPINFIWHDEHSELQRSSAGVDAQPLHGLIKGPGFSRRRLWREIVDIDVTEFFLGDEIARPRNYLLIPSLFNFVIS